MHDAIEPDHGRHRRRLTKRTTAAVVLATALATLTGCTEKLVGFNATFASNTIAIAAEPPRPGGITFRLRKPGAGPRDARVYARPDRAILKLSGFMPVTVDGAQEADNGFVVWVTLPEDAVKSARTDARSWPRYGDLLLPIETGVVSFTGTEHRISRTQSVAVTVEPVFEGPMTRLAERIGSFLRGLYAAR